MSVVTYAPLEALDLVLSQVDETRLLAGARTVDGACALDLALHRCGHCVLRVVVFRRRYHRCQFVSYIRVGDEGIRRRNTAVFDVCHGS